MKKVSLIIISVVLVLGAIYYYLNPPALELEAITLAEGTVQQSIEDTGVVQASDNYYIYSTQGGEIIKLSIKIGDQVQAGQIVASLANLDLNLQSSAQQAQIVQTQAGLNSVEAAIESFESLIESLEIDLADARKDYERAEKLFIAGALSQSDLEKSALRIEQYEQNILAQEKSIVSQEKSLGDIRNQISVLEKSLYEISQKQGELTVSSPISGTVVEIPAQKGQFIAQGTPIAKVLTTNRLEVKLDVISDDMKDVNLGQKVEISAPFLGDRVLEGSIIQIYPQAEEKLSALGVLQRRVPVIISLEENAGLKPGYEVRARIKTNVKERTIVIPRESLRMISTDEQMVMLIEDGLVKYSYIKTGLRDRNNVEVIEGLKLGDQIVKDGSLDIAENTRIKILGEG